MSFKYPPAVSCLPLFHQGKVRDTFDIPGYSKLLLPVATNRVSTHNIVHESVIGGKGHALTALTSFWMRGPLKGINTHLVASGRDIYRYLPDDEYPDDLHLRAIIVKKLKMIPVEFIFRSRMGGSLWKKFYSKGLPNPYGQELPTGLQLMSRFGEPLFTPTDKSETDDPLNAEQVIRDYPDAYRLALQVYNRGRFFAIGMGIEIIDGKFEIGIDEDGQVCLADECLTPDCCRFVKAGTVVVGQEPDWFDKQILREEAERMWNSPGGSPLEFSPDI